MLLTRVATALACTLFAVSCSSDETADSTTSTIGPAVEAGKPFPQERCDANEAAGTITYLSGFDFAAAASIVDVLVAEQKGYYDDLCLDVEVLPSFSSENYQLVAGNEAQMASGGSFSEVVSYVSDNTDAELVVVAVEGKTAIDCLIVKEGAAETLADLRGTTIGVKTRTPVSVNAMLAKAGLVEGTDYSTILLEGFNPLEHIKIPEIVGLPGWKSNEPGRLDRAGVPYTLFDPSAEGIPGSFGVLFSSKQFVTEHPMAAEDFLRATMLGLADAIADPSAASMIAVDFIDNNGNPNFLDSETETFRWQTEAKLVVDTTPSGDPVGLPDNDGLTAEVKAYAEVGLFGGKAPNVADYYDDSLLRAVYDQSDKVIWPSKQ